MYIRPVLFAIELGLRYHMCDLLYKFEEDQTSLSWMLTATDKQRHAVTVHTRSQIHRPTAKWLYVSPVSRIAPDRQNMDEYGCGLGNSDYVDNLQLINSEITSKYIRIVRTFLATTLRSIDSNWDKFLKKLNVKIQLNRSHFFVTTYGQQTNRVYWQLPHLLTFYIHQH